MYDPEWQLRLWKDPAGDVYAHLVQLADNGQWEWVADDSFGPFDTASDVAQWFIRHWSPRAKMRLR